MATQYQIALEAVLDKEKSNLNIEKNIKEIENKLKLNVGLNVEGNSATALKNAINGISDASKEASEHTQGLGDIVGKFTSWQIVGDVIHGVKDAMEDMVQQVFDLDQSLTELSKVTNLDSSGLKQMESDAFDVATQIGSTGKDVIDATTIFAQAGYEAKDALDLSKEAITLKNVSEAGATAEGSAQTLISTLKGFKNQGLESVHIVDSLNAVSNKYAVSVNDLSTGIKKASAAMAANGTTYEQMLGLLTAGTEIMQQPGKIANALSTISARLTAKNDDYIASITHGQGTVNDYTGELRSTYDILSDIAKVYPTLTSVQQQELIETVAGKTQKTALTSILSNFNNAIGATEVALNSEGSATQENEKRMNSLQGKLNSLTSEWQKLSTETINSDFVKNLLGIATGIMKITDSAGGLLPILISLGSPLLILKSGSVSNEIGKISTSFQKLLDNTKALGGGFTNFSLSLAGVKAGTKEATVAMTGFAATAGTLSTVLGVLGIAIGLISTGYNLYNNHIKETRENTIKAISDAKDEIDTKTTEKTTLEGNIKTLEEEKKAFENEQKAQGNSVDSSSEYIKSKDDEINKKKESIATTEAEIQKEKDLIKAKAGTLKTNDSVGLFTGNIGKNARDNMTPSQQLDLAKSSKNVADYRKNLQSLILELQKKKDAEKEGSASYNDDTKAIKELNNALDETKDQYDENVKVAQQFYQSALLNGEATNYQKEAMEKYLDLSDEDIESVEKGTDVLSKNTDTTDTQTTAIDNLTKSEENYKSMLSQNVDTLASYEKNMTSLTTAQNELNSIGNLTAATFKSLTDNNLLQYLEVVNGKLQINSKAFEDNAQSTKNNAIANLQASAATQIQTIMVNDLNGKYSDMDSKAILAATATADASNTAGASIENYKNLANAVNYGSESFKNFYVAQTTGQSNVPEYKELSNQAKEAIDVVVKQTEGATKAIGSLSLKSVSSTKSSSASAAKAARESADADYKATVDSLYKYKNAVDIAENSVKVLQDTLKSTQNYDKQESYMKELIDALGQQIDKTKELKSVQSNQINDYAQQLRNLGFSVDYNNDKNELYINNLEHLGDLSGDTAKSTEKIISEIQKLNTDNVSLDGNVRTLTNDISDYNTKLSELPTEKIKKFNDLFKSFQQSQLTIIQNQITDIEHAEKNDTRLNALKTQLEVLEKQTDETDKQAELQEKILAVEKAKIALENAEKQKTLQVYRSGQGFVWEVDPDKIKEAQDTVTSTQKDLADKQASNTKDAIQSQIDAIEDSYTKQKDKLQDFLDEQNYQIDKSNREAIESLTDLSKALEEYGLNNAKYLGEATDWLNKYNNAISSVKNNILGSSNVLYNSNSKGVDFSSLTSGLSFTGLNGTNTAYSSVGTSNNQNIYIDKIELPNVKDANDFIEALKILPTLANSTVTKRT